MIQQPPRTDSYIAFIPVLGLLGTAVAYGLVLLARAGGVASSPELLEASLLGSPRARSATTAEPVWPSPVLPYRRLLFSTLRVGHELPRLRRKTLAAPVEHGVRQQRVPPENRLEVVVPITPPWGTFSTIHAARRPGESACAIAIHIRLVPCTAEYRDASCANALRVASPRRAPPREL
jgi:hypothetical protein